MKKWNWSAISSIIGIIGCLVLYGILLWMCLKQMRMCGDPVIRNINEPSEMVISLHSGDSIVDAVYKARLDSLVGEIKLHNEYSENQILNGLNDLRQETNNVIDKQNLWLSFWLGILALVGALLPFFFQMKWSNEQKREIEELKKHNEELEKSTLTSEITRLTYTIITCKENRWGEDYIDRNLLWNDLLSQLCKKSNRIIELISPGKKLLPEDVYYIKTILLQLHSVYSAFLPACSQQYKFRKLKELTNLIVKIIDDLSHNRLDCKGLRDALDKMRMRMVEFSL